MDPSSLAADQETVSLLIQNHIPCLEKDIGFRVGEEGIRKIGGLEIQLQCGENQTFSGRLQEGVNFPEPVQTTEASLGCFTVQLRPIHLCDRLRESWSIVSHPGWHLWDDGRTSPEDIQIPDRVDEKRGTPSAQVFGEGFVGGEIRQRMLLPSEHSSCIQTLWMNFTDTDSSLEVLIEERSLDRTRPTVLREEARMDIQHPVPEILHHSGWDEVSETHHDTQIEISDCSWDFVIRHPEIRVHGMLRELVLGREPSHGSFPDLQPSTPRTIHRSQDVQLREKTCLQLGMKSGESGRGEMIRPEERDSVSSTPLGWSGGRRRRLVT